MSKRYFTFKKGVHELELTEVTPLMLKLFAGFLIVASDNSLPVEITCIKQHIPGRVSTTHKEGRAIDISVRGWSKFDIETVCDKINEKYESIAAISYSDMIPRACVYHEGTAYHIHLQVRRSKGRVYGKEND